MAEDDKSAEPTKPAFVSDSKLEEMLRFLDAIRDEGKINMFGAAVPLRQVYSELKEKQSREVLAYWMKTYSARHGKTE